MDSEEPSNTTEANRTPAQPVETEVYGPIEVVYRDEHYIAVVKPNGLLVHRAPQTPKEDPVLLQLLRDQIGQYLYPVHRLDRPTRGLIIFGLHSDAAARLVRLFTDRKVKKSYHAVVRGFVPPAGVIDLPLRERFGEEEDPDFDPAFRPTQPAKTRFRAVSWFEMPWANAEFPTSRYSLVEALPETGRWHQIRRHLKHIDHPILGDYRHGDSWHNQKSTAETGIDRLLLTATHLEFIHPFTEQPLVLDAPLGEPIEKVLEVMRSGQVAIELSKVPEHKIAALGVPPIEFV